jgi:uncharacterized protein YciW
MSASDLIATLSGAGPALAGLLAERAEIMRLSQASHDAVLLPRAPGGLGHAERAALAARMVRHNREPELETHDRRLLLRAGETPVLAAVAEAVDDIAMDGRLRAIVRHVDLVTLAPKDASKADIAALAAAGLSEPDIVRLAELIAFVNYQARVIAGLRLLGRLA